MTTALVFPGATGALLRAHLPAGARVLAVDAGAEACLSAGVVPEVVLGDMDSASPETLRVLEARGARIERHPRRKDLTDGQLALRLVKDDEVVFLGAGGGRADHALANLHLLVGAGASARAWARDETTATWVVTPARPLALDLPEATTLSLLAFGGPVTGITTRGLEWALEGAAMETGDPYGVSNVARAAPQEVRVGAGTLLVIAILR